MVYSWYADTSELASQIPHDISGAFFLGMRMGKLKGGWRKIYGLAVQEQEGSPGFFVRLGLVYIQVYYTRGRYSCRVPESEEVPWETLIKYGFPMAEREITLV